MRDVVVREAAVRREDSVDLIAEGAVIGPDARTAGSVGEIVWR